jgi:phage shock protein A
MARKTAKTRKNAERKMSELDAKQNLLDAQKSMAHAQVELADALDHYNRSRPRKRRSS